MAVIDKRETKEGEITYRVRIRIKGRPVQTATFKRLTDAKRWAQQTEAEIRQGHYFKTLEAKKHTLSEAIDRYIETVLPFKPKVYKIYHMQLKWWESQLGSYYLFNITPFLISEAKTKLANGITFRGDQRAPATVNRYLASLSHLFTTAIKEWGWIENNPVSNIARLPEPDGRDRYLSDEERHRLLEACKKSDSPYLYLAVILGISTGGRKMEIFGLRWENIDFDRKMIPLKVDEIKTKKRRSLKLTGYALELMKAYAELWNFPKKGWLFPSERVADKPIDLRKPWEKALKQSGVSDFKFHDLRHTAASYLAMNNATLADIAE